MLPLVQGGRIEPDLAAIALVYLDRGSELLTTASQNPRAPAGRWRKLHPWQNLVAPSRHFTASISAASN
jgi:hypothetical protein